MGGRIVPEELSDKEMCTITLYFGCDGGKGGFGSLLRNQAQTRRKITNWDHSRDRDGRRIGNVKNESSLIEFFKKRRDEESKISSEVEQVHIYCYSRSKPCRVKSNRMRSISSWTRITEIELLLLKNSSIPR